MTSEAMTSQEALAQALVAAGLVIEEYPMGLAEAQAAAILAALPEGWVLREGECIEATLEVTDDEVDAEARGAAQERERLRGLWDGFADWRQAPALVCAAYEAGDMGPFIAWLLADPEAPDGD